MAWNGQTEEGWLCSYCNLKSRRHAIYCATCGGHWEEVLATQTSTPRGGRHAGQANRGASPRQRADAGGAKDQGKGQSGQPPRGRGKGRRRSRRKKDAGEELTSPFQSYTTPTSWTNSGTPFPATSSQPSATTVQSEPINEEILAHLQDAYADKEMPQDVKALVEKAQATQRKSVIKGLHSATKELDRASQKLTEAVQEKRKHRSQWMQHLEESIQLWQTQLASYKKRQAELREAAKQAQKDVLSARQSINEQNAQALPSKNKPAQPAKALDDVLDLTGDRGRRGSASEEVTEPPRAMCWHGWSRSWICLLALFQEGGRDARHLQRRGGTCLQAQTGEVRRTSGVSSGSEFWCPVVNQFHEPHLDKSSWLEAEAYDLDFLPDRAACFTTLPRVDPCFTACSHSVELEQDYKSPWRALGNAWNLRYQVLVENECQPRRSSPWRWRALNSALQSQRNRNNRKSISFDNLVHCQLVDDNNQLCGWQLHQLSDDAGGVSAVATQEPTDDACSLMARRPQPSSPSSATGASDFEIHEPSSPSSGSAREPASVWRSVQVYDLHSGHARGRVQVRPPELHFIHTRRLLGYTHHDIAHIFSVQPPPEDLAAVHVEPLLIVRHDDLFYGDHRRAVLFDVELHGIGPTAIIDTDRYTALIPHQVHREHLLRIAGVAPYCKMQQHRCLVWLRGALLPAHSTGLFTVQHGDYVRIATPPFENPDIPTHFAIRACQAGLTRSQLVLRFCRQGDGDEDLFTDVEAAQHAPQPQPLREDEVDDAPLLQLPRPKSLTLHNHGISGPTMCRIDGDYVAPVQFERSLPGAFRNHAEAREHNILPSWIADMHEAFTESAAAELEEEGPVGYIDTWLLRGHRAYVTEEARVFRADQYLEFWQEEIAELWRDRLNLNQPLQFHWVRPTPKALATRNRISHLLLLQDPHPTLEPTLITIDMIGHQRTAFGFAAALLTNPVEIFQVRDLLQLARHCLDRRCEMRWFDRVWQPGVPQHVPSGAGLQFQVLPPIELVHLGNDHTVDSAIPISSTLPAEPLAPAHLPLEAHSEFVRILHASWLTLATTGPAGLEYVLRIQTWYLESGFVRHHDECRDVILGEDFWNWEESISRRWADFVLLDSPLDFHLVLPSPPTASCPNEIHIILAQRLRELECTSLVTTYDNAVLRGAPYTAAMILPAAVLAEDILRATGKHVVCPPHAPTSTCTCWHGGRLLPFGLRYPNRNGFAFILIVHRPLPPNFWDEDSDRAATSSFLQIQAAPTNGPGRRLTAGQVAHTQRPPLDPTEKQQTIDLHSPIRAFETFDSHFFLVDFVLESVDVSHPAAPWLADWWDYATPCSELWIYYDGSATHSEGAASVTAAAAAFVKIHNKWYFAGAISTPLPYACDSYSAEHFASAIGLKLSYDLLKIHEALGSAVPDLHFCFGSLTVGHQTAGLWHCFKHPILGAVLRNIHRLVEARFDPTIHHWHVRGHSGHPGNELVDHLAQQAHAKGTRRFHEMACYPWNSCLQSRLGLVLDTL